MVEQQFVSAPLMLCYPLTVLCFSLQKSLAPIPIKCSCSRSGSSSKKDPWDASVSRSLSALHHKPRLSLTCVRPGRLCIQQFLQDTLPTDLTRSFIWLQARAAKHPHSFSRSSIIILNSCHPHHGRGPSLSIWMDNHKGTAAGPPRLCPQ